MNGFMETQVDINSATDSAKEEIFEEVTKGNKSAVIPQCNAIVSRYFETWVIAKCMEAIVSGAQEGPDEESLVVRIVDLLKQIVRQKNRK